jgi:thiol-disulfide isomerase/thioredoxin
VPSCDLTGLTLNNFALYDLNGQPWEYRTNRRGRLVLLDFWQTSCVPCLQAITHLRILQQSYGPNGLEVIGIAYQDGPITKQIEDVNRVRQLRQINYLLLLGGDRGQCPVRSQFAIGAYPTLVLLDETGRIIWRSEGLTGRQLGELETIIKQRLGVR